LRLSFRRGADRRSMVLGRRSRLPRSVLTATVEDIAIRSDADLRGIRLDCRRSGHTAETAQRIPDSKVPDQVAGTNGRDSVIRATRCCSQGWLNERKRGESSNHTVSGPAGRSRAGRTLVVGGSEDWRRGVARLVSAVNLVPEITSWSEASNIDQPKKALIAYVDGPHVEADLVTGVWASQAMQPATSVSIAPEPGAASLQHSLVSLGFERLLKPRPAARTGGKYWQRLERDIKRLSEQRFELVPVLADLLDCSDTWIVQVLATAIEYPTPGSLGAWLERLRLPSAEVLHARLLKLGLPPPKPTLDAIRLARAAYVSYLTGATRDDVAAECGFTSGDYLGRRSKVLAGVPFGSLTVDRAVSGLR